LQNCMNEIHTIVIIVAEINNLNANANDLLTCNFVMLLLLLLPLLLLLQITHN
jgi:hypothetical protein